MGEAQILLVEDNPGDVRLIVEGLRDAKMAKKLHVVGDGEEAIEFLRGQGRHTDAPRPDLVLLDLNLPRLEGHEVLAEIKSDPDLAMIPIIVLTSSSAEEDIVRCYQLHANCFITKPVDFRDVIAAVRSLESFWLDVVRLPTR